MLNGCSVRVGELFREAIRANAAALTRTLHRRSFEADGRERLIEVKTTNGWERTPFHITRSELEVRFRMLLEEAGPEAVLLSTLVVRREERRAGWGKRLLGALIAAFPGRGWYVPAVVPEDPAGAFLEGSGWERERLNQLEMRLRLAPFGPKAPVS